MLVKKGLPLAFLTLLLVAVGCGDPESEDVETEGTEGAEETQETEEAEDSTEEGAGGELNVAFDAQPPTLDPHITTAASTRDTARLVYETLLTLDEQLQPVPLLADSIDESEDGTTYTFELREGITFHNGNEMTSEDVVVSMNRWLEHATEAAAVLGEDATFEADGDYTVVLEMEEPSTVALNVLAEHSQFAGIMPAELIESADETGVSEHIGTGPFEFEDWAQDQHIHFTKYEDYQPVDGEPDGLAGNREALVDDVYFHIASDPSTRFSGLQTGEYDIAYQIPADNYEQLMDQPNLDAIIDFSGSLNVVYNKREGIMADVDMRQAVNAAMDIDAILQASLIHEDLYRAGPSYMTEDAELWASEAGGEQYNINDPEVAEAHLSDAGYDGEEITLMVSRDYQRYYDAGVVIQQQLEGIGMNVELEVYDWPTFTELREDPSEWDFFVNGHPYPTEPSGLLELSPGYAGGIEEETVESMLRAMHTAESQEAAAEQWDELQEYAWTEFVPITKLGTYSSFMGVADHVNGASTSNGLVVWNTSVEN